MHRPGRRSVLLGTAALLVAAPGCSLSGSVDTDPTTASSTGSVVPSPGPTAPSSTPAAAAPAATPAPGSPTPTPASSGVEVIAFAPGATSASVAGTADAGEFPRYTFQAREGQHLVLALDPVEGPANVALVAPDGTPLKRTATEARRFEADLTQTGTYRVSIGSATAGASYVLRLQIE